MPRRSPRKHNARPRQFSKCSGTQRETFGRNIVCINNWSSGYFFAVVNEIEDNAGQAQAFSTASSALKPQTSMRSAQSMFELPKQAEQNVKARSDR